jgi:lipoprotein NlpD
MLGLMVAGCAGVPSVDSSDSNATSDNSGTYLVKPQDTLYSIAWRHRLDYHDLARWNHLGSDFRIVVGQTLILHGGAAAPNAPSAARPPAPRGRPDAAGASPKGPLPGSILKWAWPTDHRGSTQTVPAGGILITGRLGQEVRAACAGRVVYVGDGIRGYGNLIIVKHGENLLSAYAHNLDVAVHESEEVMVGQVIGHMGEGAPGKPVLYFEIRRDGKPVEVLPFLPK